MYVCRFLKGVGYYPYTYIRMCMIHVHKKTISLMVHVVLTDHRAEIALRGGTYCTLPTDYSQS